MARRKLGLLECMKKGLIQEVRFLLEFEGDVSSKDGDGRTALILCPFIEDQQWATGLARHLLEKGVSLRQRDHLGRNALHYACIYERIELTKVLLGAVDFDLNMRDKHGNTALFYAVLSNSSVLTELLARNLARYKLTINKPNKDGMTPFKQATLLKYTECETVLRRFQVSTNEKKQNTDEYVVNHDLPIGDRITVNPSNPRPKSAHAACMPSRSKIEVHRSVGKRPPISSLGSSSSSRSLHQQRPSRPKSSRIRGSNAEFGHQSHPIAQVRETKKLIRFSTCLKSGAVSPADMFVQNGESTCSFNGQLLGDGQSHRRGLHQRPRTWRAEVRELFATYEQQLTESYRVSVKPQIIEVPCEETPPISPVSEHDVSEDVEVRFNGGRRMSRRMSLATSKTIVPVPTDFPKRRASIAVPRMGRRSSGIDSTSLKPKPSPSVGHSPSTESVGSMKLPRRLSKDQTKDHTKDQTKDQTKDTTKNIGSESLAKPASLSISNPAVSLGGEPLSGFNVTESSELRGSHTSAHASRSETLPVHNHETLYSTHSVNVLPVHEEHHRHMPQRGPSSRGLLHDPPLVIVTVPSDESQIEVQQNPAISRESVHMLTVLTEADEC